MERFLAFLFSWFKATPELPPAKTDTRRRRKSDLRPRKARYSSKLIRRIVRRHENGLRCRSGRAAERRRSWVYYIGEIFAVQRRGWMMKNKVRKKIGKASMRFATLARKEAGFSGPVKLPPTRAERKAAEREEVARKRRLRAKVARRQGLAAR